ncbi:MAG TPA: metalloregulator ArsR/SmtB family transcription factor [Ktedonosporobacter sp.]|nr:metalloregulator ArsR/SmtB family transcription factor [Ktedonosporobacter sp.]
MSEKNTLVNEQNEKKVPRRPPELDKYVDTFLSAICDTSRRYILELLASPSSGDSTHLQEMRSGDIARLIGLSAATTSEHLRQLTRLGLLTSRREKNVVYYRLRNHELVKAFHDLLLGMDQDYASRRQPQ